MLVLLYYAFRESPLAFLSPSYMFRVESIHAVPNLGTLSVLYLLDLNC